jgi:DNA-binding response OmpR family regulator
MCQDSADVRGAGDVRSLSLARPIRQTHPEADVILTSGVTSAAPKATHSCDDGSIKKPYSSREVDARIKLLLERRRA